MADQADLSKRRDLPDTVANRGVTISLCFAIAVLEGFDIQALGVAAPRLAPELHLNAAQMGWLFTIGSIGIVLGASLGGRLADRFGRKLVLLASVLAFGVFTLGAVLAHGFNSFSAMRALAGIGFGSALPNMMAMASEISLPQRRSFTASTIFVGMPVGGGVAAALTQFLPAGYDWRALFVVGGVLPLLLLPAMWRLMPETFRPAVRAASAPPATSSLVALFGGGRAAATLLLWLTFFPTLTVLYLFLNWLPTLVAAKGLARSVAPLASVLFNFASVAGALVLGYLVDRRSVRWPLSLAYAGLIVALVGLGSATSLGPILWWSACAGFTVLGTNYALYGEAAAYYPTSMRGTGSGASVAVGRVGSIFGPLLAGILLSGGSDPAQVIRYLIPAAALAGIAVFALSFVPHVAHTRE
jgi:AAHS family 3-hydroxyphenylpropionic acid transporter